MFGLCFVVDVSSSYQVRGNAGCRSTANRFLVLSSSRPFKRFIGVGPTDRYQGCLEGMKFCFTIECSPLVGQMRFTVDLLTSIKSRVRWHRAHLLITQSSNICTVLVHPFLCRWFLGPVHTTRAERFDYRARHANRLNPSDRCEICSYPCVTAVTTLALERV